MGGEKEERRCSVCRSGAGVSVSRRVAFLWDGMWCDKSVEDEERGWSALDVIVAVEILGRWMVAMGWGLERRVAISDVVVLNYSLTVEPDRRT